jgi:hypothetical protein
MLFLLAFQPISDSNLTFHGWNDVSVSKRVGFETVYILNHLFISTLFGNLIY